MLRMSAQVTSRWLHKHRLHLVVKVREGGSPLQLISGPGHLWSAHIKHVFYRSYTDITHCWVYIHPGAPMDTLGYERVLWDFSWNMQTCKCEEELFSWKTGGKATDLWTRPWFPGCKRRAIGAPSASAARSHDTGWCKGQSRPLAFPAADPVESRRACESIRALWDHW